MFKNIKEDIKVVYYEKNIKNYLKAFLEHSVHIVLLFRLGNYCDRRVPIFGKILRFVIEYLIRILYGSDISCKAKIGKGFRIMHGHDIVIGANVIIGDYCKIFNGVTLGNKNTEIPDSKQPTLEDNVVISTGAKVLGGITIGKSSIIGANSVVIKDIPSKSIVVGIPGRIIKKNEN